MTARSARLLAAVFLAALLAASPAPSAAGDEAAAPPAGIDTGSAASADEEDFREPSFGEAAAPPARVADPIEPFNRAMFVFNDRAYYWVIKPVAKGYNHVVNEDIRVSVRNFFSNLSTPARVANHLLQGEVRSAGTELLRFLVNSTTGILGLFDTARDNWGIRKRDTDLGLTLGKYGLGHGMYLVLPLLGPSSLRDGVGSFGDSFLEPLSHVNPDEASVGLKAYKEVNKLSLRLGQYEELTGAAVDPYVAVRDFYIQNRESEKRGRIRDNW